MNMAKTLFDFGKGTEVTVITPVADAKPTRVEAEVETKQPQSAVEHLSTLSEKADFDWWKTPVYLATPQGFNNYCNNCPRLLEKSEIRSDFWKYRVVCALQRCEK